MLQDAKILKKIADPLTRNIPPAPEYMGRTGAPPGYSGGFGNLPPEVQRQATAKANEILSKTDPNDFSYKEKFSVEHEGKIYQLIAKSEGHFDNHPNRNREPWWHRGISIYVLSDPSQADISAPIIPASGSAPISSAVKSPEKLGKLTQIVVFYLKKKGKLKSLSFQSNNPLINKISKTVDRFEKMIKSLHIFK